MTGIIHTLNIPGALDTEVASKLQKPETLLWLSPWIKISQKLNASVRKVDVCVIYLNINQWTSRAAAADWAVGQSDG